MNHDPVYISRDDLHSWALRMMQSANEEQHDRRLPWSFRDYSHGIRQINQGHQLKESFLKSFLKGKNQHREKTTRSFLSRRFSVFPPARQKQTIPAIAPRLSLPLKDTIFLALPTPAEFIQTSGLSIPPSLGQGKGVAITFHSNTILLKKKKRKKNIGILVFSS